MMTKHYHLENWRVLAPEILLLWTDMRQLSTYILGRSLTRRETGNMVIGSLCLFSVEGLVRGEEVGHRPQREPKPSHLIKHSVPTSSCFSVRTDIRTYGHTDIRTYGHTDIRTYGQTDIQTYRHTDIRTYRHTDIRTYRHTDIQTE
jgi:hypothetical protein